MTTKDPTNSIFLLVISEGNPRLDIADRHPRHLLFVISEENLHLDIASHQPQHLLLVIPEGNLHLDIAKYQPNQPRPSAQPKPGRTRLQSGQPTRPREPSTLPQAGVKRSGTTKLRSSTNPKNPSIAQAASTILRTLAFLTRNDCRQRRLSGPMREQGQTSKQRGA